jgi:hypothetical protein
LTLSGPFQIGLKFGRSQRRKLELSRHASAFEVIDQLEFRA